MHMVSIMHIIYTRYTFTYLLQGLYLYCRIKCYWLLESSDEQYS